MQRYDVIIIGAGPSGAIASKTCAEKGLSTLLLEKYEIPRFKLCGGAVSMSALSHVDFGIERDLIERDGYGERVHFKNRQIEVRLTRLMNKYPNIFFRLLSSDKMVLDKLLGGSCRGNGI